MGKLSNFLSTSCVTKLSFVSDDPTQGMYYPYETETVGVNGKNM